MLCTICIYLFSLSTCVEITEAVSMGYQRLASLNIFKEIDIQIDKTPGDPQGLLLCFDYYSIIYDRFGSFLLVSA